MFNYACTLVVMCSRKFSEEFTIVTLLCYRYALRKKCPYLELYWSVFSPNAGKYGQNNYEYGHFSRSNIC